MHPILFQIKGFTFYTHGLLAVLGICLGSIIIYLLAKREKQDTALLFDNIVYTVLAGILGARIVYYLLYHEQFSSFWEFFQLWHGGMVSYGGFILGGLSLYFILKFQKQPILKWLDLYVLAFFPGLFLGRIGNIFAGEYAGVYSSGILSLNGYIPVTLYESVLCLLIFGIILFIYYKIKSVRAGTVFLIGVLLYGGGRFILDFWRDEKDLFYHLSIGQMTSLLIMIVAAAGLAIYTLKRGKEQNENVIPIS